MVVEIGFTLSASLKNKNVHLKSWPIWLSNYSKSAPVRPGSVRAICEKGFIVDTVLRIRLCWRMQLRSLTGGRRRKAWLNATKWKGRSSAGRKVATRCASPSDQSLTSQIRRRTVSTARRICQVASTLVVGVRRGAKTGHFPTDTQPSPVRTVVHLAVKCNSSHCGIKTDSTHNRRRSETRTQAGGTGAASGRRGKRSSRRRWARPPRTRCLRSGLFIFLTRIALVQVEHGHLSCQRGGSSLPRPSPCWGPEPTKWCVLRSRCAQALPRKKKLERVTETEKVQERWKSCGSIIGTLSRLKLG